MPDCKRCWWHLSTRCFNRIFGEELPTRGMMVLGWTIDDEHLEVCDGALGFLAIEEALAPVPGGGYTGPIRVNPTRRAKRTMVVYDGHLEDAYQLRLEDIADWRMAHGLEQIDMVEGSWPPIGIYRKKGDGA